MCIAARVMLLASFMVARGASLAAAQGPEGLAGLREGEVRHGFTARAAYFGFSGTPVGARFVHRTGVLADVLFFASVPQISISVWSLPVSDRGEPHALEHLVWLRGLSGTYLQTLQRMRLATVGAGTYRDRTLYQFRTSAGPEAFYELLTQYLAALVRPDFSDEEARREVAGLEVVTGADGQLTLLMKGAVYNELMASMARPGYRQPLVLKKMVFGSDHPLARYSGGDPAQLWDLSPEALRAFHRANYRIGPGLALVAALPLTWSADEFLKRLDALLAQLTPPEAAPGPRPLPPFRPAPSGEIRIGTYPSASADVPQDVLLGWPALPELTSDEWDALEILLGVIGGGDISYLHQDLVDQKTRSFDSGVTGVAADLEYVTASYPYVTLRGLPASALERAHLERLRAVVVKRFQWIAELPDGSSELSNLAAKARSRLAAARRAYLKFLDSPPNFGRLGADRRWHDRLNRVTHAPGFVKSVAPLALYDRLDRDLAAGRNPWRSLVRRVGLFEVPYVVALRPDPALAEQEKSQIAQRLKRHEAQLAERLGGSDVQKALAAFGVQQEAKTAELVARDRAAPKPRFVSDPPLTLDDVPFEQGKLAGVPLVRVHFDTTPFTDVALAFDLSGVSPSDDEWMLLPLFDAALSGLGITISEGKFLDYVQARQRRDSEIYSFSIAPVGNPVTRRHELEVLASASSAEEIPRAVDWMENYILRPGRGEAARARLVDLCRQTIQSYRGVLETSEYSWTLGLAGAFEYQDDPLQLALSSVFTKLRLMTRVRWRLEDPSPEARKSIEAELAAIEDLLAGKAPRATVTARLEAVTGELGETLRYELSTLPADRWREDLAEVVNDLRDDLEVGSARVLEGFERLRRRVFVRRGARARVTASPTNAEAAVKLLDALLTKLPEEGAIAPPPPRFSSVHARLEQRYGRLSRPVHVGFVRPGAKSGVHLVTANGPSYTSRSREAALESLAVGIFSGSGPHTFFMKTSGVGLAYSNGIEARPWRGRIIYYAERCPDLARTMNFVSSVAAGQPLDDPFLLEYGLTAAFADFRGANDFSSRGAALAANLADGLTPDQVSGFKQLLLETAREKEALVQVRERLPDAVGRMIVGYGRKVSASPGAVGFVIGPEEMLAKYEVFLKEQGEADRLIRLYPRDFWPLPKEATKPTSEPSAMSLKTQGP